MQILVVEDEIMLAESLKEILEKNKHTVYLAYDGEEGMEIARSLALDMIILDVMLPKLNGYQVARGLRKDKKGTLILMLTARSDLLDRVEGLESGADDYLTKPFNPLELVARVKSQLRRYTELGNVDSRDNMHLYTVGDLVINDETKEVQVSGNNVKLTPIEYNILLLLVKNAGKVFSIDEIYEKIWNEEAIGADNTVAVHIRHIREKIEINPKEPRYLKVVWGVGYKVEKKP